MMLRYMFVSVVILCHQIDEYLLIDWYHVKVYGKAVACVKNAIDNAL